MRRICVFGMGGIGGYVAAHLISAKSAGPEELFITCIARGESLEVLNGKGLCFRKPGGQEDFFRPDLVTDNPASLPEQEIIFLCVKGYDLAAACRAIGPIVTPQTVIIPLLNGIDIFERVRAVISSGIVLPSCIYISALRQAPGCTVHVGGKGNIISGEDPAHRGFNPASLVSLMAAADIPFEWQADSFPALWKKYFFIASYALVTGMSGKCMGQILESPELSAVVQDILKEIYAIASAKLAGASFAGASPAGASPAGEKGAALPESIIMASYENARNFPYETTTSFARDLQVPGKPNEAELFGATILRLGKELGIPAPATKAAHEAVLKKVQAGQ